jgi:predicted transcriptional regulator
MNLKDVQQLLQAQVLAGEELLEQTEVKMVCGSDLISDVLAFTKEKTLLLTGLTNPQIIRTAEMIELSGIVFVRGKLPSEDVIELAEEHQLPLLLTKFPLYETCGILYSAGLNGCSELNTVRRG